MAIATVRTVTGVRVDFQIAMQYNAMKLFKTIMKASARAHEDFDPKVEIEGSSDRSFGLVFAVLFLTVGCWPVRSGQPVRVWAIAIGVIFALVAAVRPALLKSLNVAWMRFGLLLGKVVSPVVLTALFYLVFTPMAALMRALGKDLLRLQKDPASASYWILRQPPGPPPETMSNQF